MENTKKYIDEWRCRKWQILNLQRNETKAARNKAIRSKVKTAIKKVDAAVAAGDKAAAQAALLAATTEIDKAATKGVYHKNNSARKVSRLAKMVNSLA